MLRDIEYLSTLASLHVKDYKYPKKEIDEMWENVLLYHNSLSWLSVDVNSMMSSQEAPSRWSMMMLAGYISYDLV